MSETDHFEFLAATGKKRFTQPDSAEIKMHMRNHRAQSELNEERARVKIKERERQSFESRKWRRRRRQQRHRGALF